MIHYFLKFFDNYHFGLCGTARTNGQDRHRDFTKYKDDVTCKECLKRIKWQEKIIPQSRALGRSIGVGN